MESSDSDEADQDQTRPDHHKSDLTPIACQPQDPYPDDRDGAKLHDNPGIGPR